MASKVFVIARLQQRGTRFHLSFSDRREVPRDFVSPMDAIEWLIKKVLHNVAIQLLIYRHGFRIIDEVLFIDRGRQRKLSVLV
jgi:hypothetical protein